MILEPLEHLGFAREPNILVIGLGLCCHSNTSYLIILSTDLFSYIERNVFLRDEEKTPERGYFKNEVDVQGTRKIAQMYSMSRGHCTRNNSIFEPESLLHLNKFSTTLGPAFGSVGLFKVNRRYRHSQRGHSLAIIYPQSLDPELGV